MIGNGNDFNYIWLVLLMFKDVFLGLVGGLVAYLFDYKKADKEGRAAIFKVSGVIIIPTPSSINLSLYAVNTSILHLFIF